MILTFDVKAETPNMATLVADLANIDGSTDSAYTFFLLDSREDRPSFST
jgi:hypothetical protein